MDTAPVICRIHVSNHKYFPWTDPCLVLTLQNCNFHSCCRFRDFCVCLSLLLCLGIMVWLQMLYKGSEAGGNGAQHLWRTGNCRIVQNSFDKSIYILLIQKFVVNFGTLSLQFLSELCSMYWAIHALTISPLTLHQLLQFASKLIPWLWTAQFGHKVLSSDHWISKISQPDFYCNLSTLISDYLMAWDFVRL
jgi:hypothetical protein